MEVCMMQPSALRCLQSLQATTSGRVLVESKNVVGFPSFNSANSLSMWKRVREIREQRVVRAASSGGTRRDQQKFVARTQKRRARHVKGVTPTKDELLDKLQEEEEADEELDRSFPEDDEEGEDYLDDEEEGVSAELNDSTEGGEAEVLVLSEKPSPLGELTGEQEISNAKTSNGVSTNAKSSEGKAKSDSNQNAKAGNQLSEQETGDDQKSGSTTSGFEEIVETGPNTYIVKFYPDGDAKGDEEKVQDQAEEVVSNVGSAAQQVTDATQDTAQNVANTAQDTARDVASTAQDTVEETGKNLREAGDTVRENVEEGLDQVGPVAQELTDIAQDTAEDVASTAQKTAEDSGKNLSEAGDAIREGISEVGAKGGEIAREGANALGEQLQEGQKEAQKNLSQLSDQAQEAGERTGDAVEKITAEVGKSAESVQDVIGNPVADGIRAAGVIGGEALRLGEVVMNVAGESVGFTEETGPGPKSATSNSNQSNKEQQAQSEESKQAEKRKSGTDAKRDEKKGDQDKSDGQKPEGRKEDKLQDDKPQNDNPYVGLKVTVAGANGRTGRLIVQELVRKGVSVRGLVRDPAKARDLAKLMNVEVVQADLYKYETIRGALGDSNVVICAIGAQSFPFDPIGTYQAEYEGVKNLVAAAKNGGKVKKFVFITTIGVTLLQIVPLIFWKKQAELYLQRSGLDYTIIRPGGLMNGGNKREKVVMKPADTQFGGAISRKKVAELCVGAVVTPEASEKIVEVVSGGRDGQNLSELFGSVN